MGSSQSIEIPGGGTEGYHVLKVCEGTKCWSTNSNNIVQQSI